MAESIDSMIERVHGIVLEMDAHTYLLSRALPSERMAHYSRLVEAEEKFGIQMLRLGNKLTRRSA